jgi:dolichyl-phosphate beta-glucosyltransferase
VARVVLVVPCYNEADRLDAGAFRRFELPGHTLEFVFVNDGSRDATAKILGSLHVEDPARFAVINLEQNIGKAEAVRRGVLAAAERSHGYVGYWDADLATPLSELPPFVELMEKRPEIDMVFAARVRLLGRDISRRPARHYFGRVGATLISSTLGLAIYDTQCGAKLFRCSETLWEVFATPFLSRWIFDVEIIARFVQRWGRDRVARSLYEVPVTQWHDVRGSKVKSRDFLRALGDLWKIHRAYNARR